MNILDKEQLRRYMYQVAEIASTLLGYPIATDFNYNELYPLLRYPVINFGSPFVDSYYNINSRSIEKEVLAFFADLFRAPKDNSWGYVTSGDDESNLYALYAARELYPQGLVYYSAATHYRVEKSIRLLNMPSIMIRSSSSGEMDYDEAFQRKWLMSLSMTL